MKISRRKLKQIIKEEISRALNEQRKCSANWDELPHAEQPNAALGYINWYISGKAPKDMKKKSELHFKFMDATEQLDAYRKNAKAPKPTDEHAVYVMKRVLQTKAKDPNLYAKFLTSGECMKLQ